MATASLLALLDDIASILDDVAVLTQLAAKKTAGVLGDDLALNAEQVSGVNADRELPVVWAVAKGSLLNKAVLVPLALVISAFVPWLITPLLMLGGLYLCFEGAEKILEKIEYMRMSQHEKGALRAAKHAALLASLEENTEQANILEKQRIKGAIRTDFVLSAEIIVIALGLVAGNPLSEQILTLIIIAIIMTIGVYGLVGVIVKLDDAGFYLVKQQSRALQTVGRGLVASAPLLMKFLTIAGTVAMFMVGGGILAHGLPALHHLNEYIVTVSGLFNGLATMLLNTGVGLAAGLVAVAIWHMVSRLRGHGSS